MQGAELVPTLAEFLEWYNHDDKDSDDNYGKNNNKECKNDESTCINSARLSRKQSKCRQFSFLFSLDFNELVSLNLGIFDNLNSINSTFCIITHSDTFLQCKRGKLAGLSSLALGDTQ
jgi:hypothetical protein